MASICRALWSSFFGRSLSYHPREATGQTNTPSEVITRIKSGLGAPACVESDHVARAKESLAEVKSQTEYQDAKAARLLTIVAFLTAAVGLLIGKFIDIYPLRESMDVGGLAAWLVSLTYASLGIYLILIACGAMITFHATATRFVWPAGQDFADQDKVRSTLFFQQITRTKPERWGKAFASNKDALMKMYYESLVVETYLVAAKASDKVRYLDPAQRTLLYAIRVLLIAFLLAIATFAAVEPTKSAAEAQPENILVCCIPESSDAPSPGDHARIPDQPGGVSAKRTAPSVPDRPTEQKKAQDGLGK